MTTFFNNKEEVINIELTPYGRHKFSLGEMHPLYYSFYDSGILYDGAYGDLTETQNNIVSRIKSGTPYIKPLSNFTSSIAEVKAIDISTSQFDKIVDSTANFYQPLGRNSPWSDFKPSWLLYTLADSVQLTHSLGTSDGYEYVANGLVPILSASEMEINYTTLDLNQNVENPEDQTTIFIFDTENEQRFYIDLLELNTVFKVNGNYDIEVFRTPRDGEDNELISLSFIDDQIDYGDELRDQSDDPYSFLNALNGDDVEQRQNFPQLTSEYVEYYLSIRVDDQIVDAPTIRPSDSLYVTNQQTPEILCSDVNNYGTDR
tara:strand:+ start:1243 stop:2193 length:951 start_codon:yes stop_codon:yes gene_type:complete